MEDQPCSTSDPARDRAFSTMPNNVTQPGSRGVRKPRKSRGRGLRTNTGCLICKRRHVKCDEARPQCGPCAKGRRPCVYGRTTGDTVDDTPVSSPQVQPATISQTNDLSVLADACHQETPLPSNNTPAVRPTGPYGPDFHRVSAASPSPFHDYIPSPATDSSAASAASTTSSKLAPLSWFELLANDAANADRDFLLSPQQALSSARSKEPTPGAALISIHAPRNPRECQSFQAASFQHDPEFRKRIPLAAVDEQSQALCDIPSSWTTSSPIQLSDQECRIFDHFVRTFGACLDFFDPSLQFSSVVPRLALHNVGLMNALLALSTRHLSLCSERSGIHIGQEPSAPIDRNAAVQYYYETLQYLNKVMRYQSYARSQELISTALLISTYEMIHGSNRDWERHLKGVFWIQRYQDNDGECGGLRQSVWWAWLRQDVWVAMRERRRVFSFWRPKKHVSTLTIPELCTRAIYLLAQCVNYASREESGSTDMEQRLQRGNELLYMLQEWQDCLPREFTPLPVPSTSEVWPPVWVHPPACAAALQLHGLARILAILYRPSIGGLQDYRAAQKLVSSSLGMICGIARMIDDTDKPACAVSLQCLFGAGLSVHTPHERAVLLDLLGKCQTRMCWPETPLVKELEAEYQKDQLSAFSR